MRTLEQQKERGERAQRLFHDEIVQDAFRSIEENIISKWRNSLADESQERDRAYIMLRLLENLKQQFLHAMNTGKAADHELLNLKDPSKIRRLISGS